MKSNKKSVAISTFERFSDQEEYYLNHLKKQKRALKNRLSILGKHHFNLDEFIRNSITSNYTSGKILDAGCGLSSWTTSSLRKKYKISGVDGEPDVINICKKLYKNQDYKVGDLYNLDYKSKEFDIVIMREVIEHFKNPEKAVKETYRILKQNGILILTTPNYSSFLLHIIEHTYNRFFGGSCKPYKEEVHPSKFTPKKLQRLLKKYFTIEKIITIDYGISQGCIARKNS